MILAATIAIASIGLFGLGFVSYLFPKRTFLICASVFLIFNFIGLISGAALIDFLGMERWDRANKSETFLGELTTGFPGFSTEYVFGFYAYLYENSPRHTKYFIYFSPIIFSLGRIMCWYSLQPRESYLCKMNLYLKYLMSSKSKIRQDNIELSPSNFIKKSFNLPSLDTLLSSLLLLLFLYVLYIVMNS